MLSVIFILLFLNPFVLCICWIGGALRRIIGGGDAIPDAPLCACHRQVQDGRREKCNFQRKKTREGNKREKAATLECVKRSSSCCMDFFPGLFLHFPTATNKREKATTPGSFTLHFFSNSCTLRFCTLTHSRTRATFSLNCNFKGTAGTDSFDHLAFFANSEQVIPGSCLMMSPHL